MTIWRAIITAVDRIAGAVVSFASLVLDIALGEDFD